MRHVLAELSFDSLNLSPAFGVRSGQSVARQLLYSAGDHDLDMRVAPDDGAWVISGQVLGDGCAGGEVFLEGGEVAEQVAMNDLCEFTLPRVVAGSYSLRLRFQDSEIKIPEFNLTA